MKEKFFLLLVAALSFVPAAACSDGSSIALDGLYRVVFQNEGETHDVQLVLRGECAREPAAPQKAGHSFAGWRLDGEAFDFQTRIQSDVTLNSSWRILQFTYRFIDDDGTLLKEETADYGAAIVAPAPPTREGHAFTGWSNEVSILTEDVTMQAQYEALAARYTYEFLDWDGAVLKAVTAAAGTLIVAPENPARAGHRFIGWDKSFQYLTADITITARYEALFTLAGKRLSILGDSISTFYAAGSAMSSNYTGNDQFYYPKYSTTVKTVDLTWWARAIAQTGMALGSNESFSGKDMVYWGYVAARAENLGKNGAPDVVIIFLGTNDNVNGHEIAMFKSRYEAAIKIILEKYADATLFCMTTGYSAYTGYYYTEARRVALNAAIRELVAQYGLGLIDIAAVQTADNYSACLGDSLHPNATGMGIYADAVVKAMNAHFGIQ